MTRVLPFPWRDVAGRNDLTNGQRRVLDEARDFGVAHGATVPIHGPDSGLSALNVVCHSGPQFEEAFWRGYRDLIWVAMNTPEPFLSLTEATPGRIPVRPPPRDRARLFWPP